MSDLNEKVSRMRKQWIFSLVFLLATPLQAAEMLTIRFTEQRPPQGKIYSSETRDPIRELRVLDGQTVKLQQQEGRHYEARAGGWRWTQVQEVPESVNAVAVTPKLDADKVTLNVDIYRQDQDRSTTFSTAVSGRLGEWLQVLGPEQQRGRGSKVYGTSGGSTESLPRGLYVKVERLPAQ